MSWTARAGLAAVLLNCAMSTGFGVPVGDPGAGQWLKDPTSSCLLFNADAHAGDSVSWTGACIDGKADGLGTATFAHDGQEQSFTADFTRGVIPDGHVTTRWGAGWSYDGETVEGRFNGAGILTTDTADRFEGQWTDGKMNGFGVLRRANGERYAGDWKDDKPNGSGELRHADGTRVAGVFTDGKLISDDKAQAVTPMAKTGAAPFGGVSGKTLTGVDGSSIALNLIEGGMELQVMPSDGNARKTTFTFMTDRMGTVVEDSGAPGAGTSVTGFFRLTPAGVEVRYADGRSAMLSANGDSGVQMALDGDGGASCRSWYPAGHAFSDMEKKAALNAYAGKLGLAVTAADNNGGCPLAPVAANTAPPVAGSAPASAAPTPKTRPERHAEVKLPARLVRAAAYRIGDYSGSKGLSGRDLESVAVKTSEIHLIDGAAPIAVPTVSETIAAAAPKPADRNDASRCLKVDSDGGHWGFRNGCDFAVQFAYCMAGGRDSLTACGAGAIAGSVAANGFGALMADTSLKDKDADHNFRWIACGGGAGEVVAHLDHFEPPGGRCERTRTASAN